MRWWTWFNRGFKDRSSAGIKLPCHPVLTDVGLDEASKKVAKGVNNVFVFRSKTKWKLMNREQAEQYTTFINSLCESGNLNWDWLDSLSSDARDHVRQNPKYIGREQISEDEFENDYGGHSILGFFDEIGEEHLFDYYYFVSNSLADPSFKNKDDQLF